MDTRDHEKIRKISLTRKEANTFYSAKSEVYRSFLEMEGKTYRDGRLSRMHKELMATAISVVINCESCMEWHIKQALDNGAGEEEIIEAVEVGIEMGGGPATVSARFAMKVLEYYTKQV